MEQFNNFAVITLASAIDNVQTIIPVDNGSLLAATGTFSVLVDQEIMTVLSRAGNNLTVLRGQEGTSAVSHFVGADVVPVMTSRGLAQLRTDAEQSTSVLKNGTGITQGTVVVIQGANIVPAGAGSRFVHAIAIQGGTGPLEIQIGPIDPGVVNLGTGPAVPVGFNSAGFPVRVTDPTCISGLVRVGNCDTTGAIFVAPVVAPNFNVLDYGAVGDCVGDVISGATDDLPAFKLAIAGARNSLTTGINNPRGRLYLPGTGPAHSYFLNGNLDVTIPLIIEGDATGFQGPGSSAISFAGGKGIILHDYRGGSPDGGDANGSQVRNLEIFCRDVPGVTRRADSTHYNVGDLIRYKYNQAFYGVCLQAGITASSEPATYENPEDISQGGVMFYRGTPWAPARTVRYGDWVVSLSHPGYLFYVQSGTPGPATMTTGSVEPTWNLTDQGTTTEGSIVYLTFIPGELPYLVSDGTALFGKLTASGIHIRTLSAVVQDVNIRNPQNAGIAIVGRGTAPDLSSADTWFCHRVQVFNCGMGIWTAGSEANAGTAISCNVYTRVAYFNHNPIPDPFVANSVNAHCYLDGSFLGNNWFGCQAQNDTIQNDKTINPDTRASNKDYWGSSIDNSTVFAACYSENGLNRANGSCVFLGGNPIVSSVLSSPSVTAGGLKNAYTIINDNHAAAPSKAQLYASLGADPDRTLTFKADDDNNSLSGYQYGQIPGWWTWTYQGSTITYGISNLRSGDIGGLWWFPTGFYRGSSFDAFEFATLADSFTGVRGGIRRHGDLRWRPDTTSFGGPAFQVNTTPLASYDGPPWHVTRVYIKPSAPPGVNANPGSIVAPTDPTNLNRFQVQNISGGAFQAYSSDTTEPNWSSAPSVGNTVTDTNTTFGTTITWVNIGTAPVWGRLDLNSDTTTYQVQQASNWDPPADTDGTPRIRGRRLASSMTTTTGSVTTVATYPLSTNAATYVDVLVLAYQGTDAATFRLSGAWWRGSGSPTVIRVPSVDQSNPNATGTAWTAVLALNGNTVEVHVTGDIGKTIKWEVVRQGTEAS